MEINPNLFAYLYYMDDQDDFSYAVLRAVAENREEAEVMMRQAFAEWELKEGIIKSLEETTNYDLRIMAILPMPTAEKKAEFQRFDFGCDFDIARWLAELVMKQPN